MAVMAMEKAEQLALELFGLDSAAKHFWTILEDSIAKSNTMALMSTRLNPGASTTFQTPAADSLSPPRKVSAVSMQHAGGPPPPNPVLLPLPRFMEAKACANKVVDGKRIMVPPPPGLELPLGREALQPQKPSSLAIMTAGKPQQAAPGWKKLPGGSDALDQFPRVFTRCPSPTDAAAQGALEQKTELAQSPLAGACLGQEVEESLKASAPRGSRAGKARKKWQVVSSGCAFTFAPEEQQLGPASAPRSPATPGPVPQGAAEEVSSTGSMETEQTEAEQEQEPEASGAMRQRTRNRKKRLCCSFVMTTSLPRLESWDFVPRLIGRGGSNMKKIASACKGKIRVRGKGSGYLEGPNQKEAALPLQVALSCESAEDFAIGRRMVINLLDSMARAFVEDFPQKKHPARFYIVVDQSV